ncbi:class I SAM-dependent methyltransferase [Pontibacter sp. CAU 1760]
MKNDPMGGAMKDFLAGEKDAQVVVASDLTEEDVIPAHYLFRTEGEMPDLELAALAACHGKVLDVGAGAGSHTLVLQQQGRDVTAIDVSLGAAEVMQQRGVRKILHQDVMDLKSEQFDTLLLLMNGIGITGTLRGLDRFLHHAKTLLRPGGQILLESSDILYMFEEEDGSVVLDLNAGYYGEVKYNMRYKDQESGWFKWLFIAGAILEDHAKAQGFAFEVLFEGEHGNYLARLSLPLPA